MFRSLLPTFAVTGALLLVASDAGAVPAFDSAAMTFSEGSIRIILPPEPMRELGFEVADVRTDVDEIPNSYLFDLREPQGLRLAADAPIRWTMAGGLAIRSWQPGTRRALSPGFLYDATLEVRTTAEAGLEIRLLAPDPGTGLMLRASGESRWDADSAQLHLAQADLRVGAGWAAALGRPELEGVALGRVEVVLNSGPARAESGSTVARAGGALLDVQMAELYGLVQQGHIGTFPNGMAGLSAATTSCNVGDVDVPWFGTMDERHPFIALAMYREENGQLEMIGQNWIKHGFFSLNDSDCDACPNTTGGNVLRVDCSDTYSASNNGSRFYLGPRAEVNPHTAEWTACGSFFDEPTVPDPDCDRSYFGSEPDGVSHRLTVSDADLNHPTATYYYEGLYIVANDDSLPNNIGWRELSGVSWSGSAWNLSTLNENPLEPKIANPGALVMTWGDQQERFDVAADDGLAILAVDTTDLGDGWWRYDYALYNRTSDRAIHSLSIPTGVAGIRNLEFRDIDTDVANDWGISTAGGSVTWSTDDWATDPNAHALEYQTLFNLRFEADLPPAAAIATGGIFRPGVGTSFSASTLGPSAVVDVPPSGLSPGLRLSLRGANPANARFHLELEVPRSQAASLSVRDVTGRLVRELWSGSGGAGSLSLEWDGRDSSGSPVASGVYFFRLETESGNRTVKGTLLR